MVDAQVGPDDAGVFGIPFDPADLAPGAFVPDTRAWLDTRTGRADPVGFGVAGVPGPRGEWFVRGHAARDLAAPRGDEPLLWDAWD